jgi:hypothetical protein
VKTCTVQSLIHSKLTQMIPHFTPREL